MINLSLYKICTPTLFLLVTILFLFPYIALAEGGLVAWSGPDCTFCHVYLLGHNIILFVTEVFTILAIIAFIVAGLMAAVSGMNPVLRTKMKQIIRNVTIGFVIMLSATIMIDLLLKAFVPSSNVNGIMNRVQCTVLTEDGLPA